MLTRMSWASLNVPSSSTASTRTITFGGSTETVAWRFGSEGEGIAQRTAWAQNFLKSPQVNQAADHLVFASDVQATERPSPYCHCARIGSARTSSGASTVCAWSLIEVTT